MGTRAPVNFEMSIKELTERDATITIVTSSLVVGMNLYCYVPTCDEPNVFNINVIKRTNVVRLSPLPQGTSFRIVGEAKLRDGTTISEELEFTTLGEKVEATTWFEPTTEQATTEMPETTEREETTEKQFTTEASTTEATTTQSTEKFTTEKREPTTEREETTEASTTEATTTQS